MAARASDRILGLVLVVVSSLWCWGVVSSIPGIDDGSRLGARGFPLGLGVLLGLLGLWVFLRTLMPAAPEPAADPQDGKKTPLSTEIWVVSATVLLLVGYAMLLEYAGFVIATAAIAALAIGPFLGVWRLRLIAGMALGMAFGIYLIFGKLLGVYLPYGKIVNLAF